MNRSDSPLRPAIPASATAPVQDASGALPLDRSVAGEEDPGASLDEFTHVPPPASGAAAASPAASAQGDDKAAQQRPPSPNTAGSKAR